MASDFEIGLGGKGANQSVAAIRAGAKVRHIGAVAKSGDPQGLAQLESHGVETDLIERLPRSQTGHAIILLDQAGENSIIIHSGANKEISETHLDQAMADIGPDDTLLLQNETNLQLHAAAHAKEAGATVIYSAAPFDVDAVTEILPHISILALNQIEYAQLTQALGAVPDVPAMLVTLGADGVDYLDLAHDKRLHQAAFAVDAVDTSGAGDCFVGYFAAGLDQRLSVEDNLRRAAAASAISVTRKGASNAMPFRGEINDFLDLR